MTSTPVRLALATGVTCCLGFVVVAESQAVVTPPDPVGAAALTERAATAAEQPASRSSRRPLTPTPTPTPSATTPGPSPSATAAAPRRTTVKRARKPRPVRPAPVAGLTRAQMDNADAIVKAGRKLGVPRRGMVIAVATAMQESNLYNLASGVLPESLNYPNQGVGYDHDSVGLFQQRPSSGWGTVAQLMRPAYAAQAFYEALLQVPGWQDLPLTVAAQAVQISGFPDAYAQHEGRATTVVAALTA